MTEPPIFTPDFFQNPYPTFEWLRENHPVYRTTIPFTDVGVWLVSRYEDVREGFADARLSSDYRTASSDFTDASLAFGAGTVAERSMVNLDPPDHTRLRKLAAATFTGRRIAQWETTIQKITGALLDAVPAGEPVDIIDNIATPLSVEVICDILGAPPGDRARLREWGDLIFTADPGERHLVHGAIESMIAYTGDLILQKKDSLSDDLLSELIRASQTPGVLSEDELLSTVIGLIVAGYETSIRLVGDAFLVLLDHPEQLSLIRRNMALVDSAIEEVLRYDGPQASSLWRFSSTDMEIAGVKIPAHEPVLLLVGSAHRDSDHYPAADSFDISREDKRHLAFGHGIHRCLGSQLARLETRVLLGETLKRFSRISLAVSREEVVYKPSLVVRGPAYLPLIFEN
ncbi:cytochrome P450 [Streptosporangium sp. NPDC005286]|uniref:cytochrome P450 family protein n=1 Tax=Streptosporangium sp. NPDC005286 TaxID=3154463 RepID=UPI0033AD1182